MAWAAYTLVGKGEPEPIAANAYSFCWAARLAGALSLTQLDAAFADPRGLGLAVLTGALTSGAGYAIWYRVLPHLGVTLAAVAQLSMPIIARRGGLAFLGERPSARLLRSGAIILASVGLVFWDRGRRRKPT